MSKELKNYLSKFLEFGEIQNEDTVNTALTVKDHETGTAAIKQCKICLQINGKTLGEDDLKIDEIINTIAQGEIKRYAAFTLLYKRAKNAAGNKIASGYITGLRMYFALDDNDHIFLIYQAVGLVNQSHPMEKNPTYKVNFDGNLYTYNGEDFTTTTDTYFNKCTKNYQDKLRINRNGIDWEPFKKGSDVESVTFSFQEIFTLLYDNKGDSLSIYNTIVFEPDVEGGERKLKHALLLAPYGLYPLAGDLTNMYANLVHLCPPNCTTMKIEL